VVVKPILCHNSNSPGCQYHQYMFEQIYYSMSIVAETWTVVIFHKNAVKHTL
jgi:hypothetical protein